MCPRREAETEFHVSKPQRDDFFLAERAVPEANGPKAGNEVSSATKSTYFLERWFLRLEMHKNVFYTDLTHFQVLFRLKDAIKWVFGAF